MNNDGQNYISRYVRDLVQAPLLFLHTSLSIYMSSILANTAEAEEPVWDIEVHLYAAYIRSHCSE